MLLRVAKTTVFLASALTAGTVKDDDSRSQCKADESQGYCNSLEPTQSPVAFNCLSYKGGASSLNPDPELCKMIKDAIGFVEKNNMEASARMIQYLMHGKENVEAISLDLYRASQSLETRLNLPPQSQAIPAVARAMGPKKVLFDQDLMKSFGSFRQTFQHEVAHMAIMKRNEGKPFKKAVRFYSTREEKNEYKAAMKECNENAEAFEDRLFDHIYKNKSLSDDDKEMVAALEFNSVSIEPSMEEDNRKFLESAKTDPKLNALALLQAYRFGKDGYGSSKEAVEGVPTLLGTLSPVMNQLAPKMVAYLDKLFTMP